VSAQEFRITLKEGRNRQIRRMVDGVGNRVKRLRRTRISRINLGDLPVGHWRYLSDIEQAGLQAEVNHRLLKKKRRVIAKPPKPTG
jgi:23S rRNA pseudouridine2604 synthase